MRTIALVFEPGGRIIVGGSVTFDGIDITAALSQCAIVGTVPPAGVSVRCPGVRAAMLGPGTHVFTVILRFSDGSNTSDVVTWEVLTAVEP